MTLRKLREAWDEFFFVPQSPIPIALFRILYGLCVSVTVILLHSDWLNWFGKRIEHIRRLVDLLTCAPSNTHCK